MTNHTHSTDQHAPLPASDEIDLRELALSLWASRLLICAVTLAVALAAAAYAFLSPAIYQSSVQTLPPPASALANYNAGSQLQKASPLPALTPQIAYQTFIRHLSSDSIRMKFFDDVYLPANTSDASEAQRDALWRRMTNEIVVTPPKQGMDVASLTVEGENPTIVADWANQYVQEAITAAREELIGNLTSAVDVAKHVTSEQIKALRTVAATTRKAREARLDDALKIAESIKLEDPPQSGNLITSYSNDNTYLRGARAIRAEIERLRSRDSDDPYIEELPDLLKQEALLSSIDLNPESLAVAAIDRSALVPEDPIKPKKALILALGIVLGGMLGVFAALARAMFRGPASRV